MAPPEARATARASNGDGTFEDFVSIDVGAEPWAIDAGDLNNDTVPDLVVTNTASGNLYAILSNR